MFENALAQLTSVSWQAGGGRSTGASVTVE